jgi:N-methylhydantoinase B
MDVRFAMPFYRNGEIFCWLSNTGHWPDTGGAVPGGFSASAIIAEQEGLRLPPVKLFKQGVHGPGTLAGDLLQHPRLRTAHRRCKGAGFRASGGRRSGWQAILDRYGDHTVRRRLPKCAARRRQMRANVRLIPDGTYTSVAYVDSDGVVNEPLTIALTITAKDDTLDFDFAGSSKPCMGPMNSVRATTLSSVYLGMRHIFPDVPMSVRARSSRFGSLPASKAHSLMPNIRGPCRAARPRSASASPRRSLPPWSRPCPTA